jgi:hypothetical protein
MPTLTGWQNQCGLERLAMNNCAGRIVMIHEVVQAVRSWRTIATRLGLTTRDQARFADSIDKNCD